MSSRGDMSASNAPGMAREVRSNVDRARAVSWRLDELGPDSRADLMHRIAAVLEESRSEVVSTAMEETSLTESRLQGELDRTASQLRVYARSLLERVAREREVLRVAERPSIFRTFAGLGPVANFEASNFPLAFGALGTDTASAFAAGCPVIVKAHPAHPRTSELCVDVAREVLGDADLQDALGIVYGGPEAARELVLSDPIAAVTFTGSPTAGRAVMDLAAARQRPIPVYAEMGSINPIVITPGALQESVLVDLAQLVCDSVTGSAGQLCTKPGMVLVPRSARGDEFVEVLASALSVTGPFEFIDDRIARQFENRTSVIRGLVQVVRVEGGSRGAWLFEHEIQDGIALDPGVLGEVFGPATLAIRYSTVDQAVELLRVLGGQLAIALHAVKSDGPTAAELTRHMARYAGRVVWCGVPTGVAIVDAMHHGGPWPSSNSIIGSVGPESIDRFRRPVTWQGVPEFAMPAHLRFTSAS